MVGFLKLELRFAGGLDVGVRERSQGCLECLGPQQLDGASCHQRDRKRWAAGWLFHVGLVRQEMSIRPVSGDDGLQGACSLHVGGWGC